ncbi:hypothetical protein [Endozoicomonas sp. 8E]|uniref:hypothetical protein n=1 Tax=Endozoicomonas sp. 8E TaxID=3035692 RepID=UPI0029393373|nr:hypothetical protein [Endozoicomonas sp. 8E]WOG26017.1 hypothetical protein P6910_15720 [Endozoicomonas sp. 8E]
MSIEGAGGRTQASSQYADLMDNVGKLETFCRQRKAARLEVISESGAPGQDTSATFGGRKVIIVKPRGNLFKRLIAFFSPTRSAKAQRAREREAKVLLHDQVMKAIEGGELSKQDRKRLVNDVSGGVIPGFSRSERENIREKILYAVLRTENIKTMLNEAEEGIKSLPGLIDKIPAVSLHDAREAMKGFYMASLLTPDRVRHDIRLEQDFGTLKQHFDRTDQSGDFQCLVTDVVREILHSLPERLSQDEYDDLLSIWGDEFRSYSIPERDGPLSTVMNQIFLSAVGKEFPFHSDPRDLVLEKDYRLIQDLKRHPKLKVQFDGRREFSFQDRQLSADKTNVRKTLNRLSAEVTRLDVDKIRERLKAGENLTKEEGQLIAKSRRALLDIQLTAGRRWELSILSQPEQWPGQQNTLTKLLKIQEIGTLRGQEIDLAQLDWLIKQHDDARTHPRVAIEGAGPTGLALALSQFEVGADVSVFDNKSTEHDKGQVVRLDLKWMDMLKFYLGEHYYELFAEGEESKGIVRSDGLGEIAIQHLEEALHDRLNELRQRNNQTHEDDEPSSLERMAAFELEGVESGEQGYKVRARYNPAYDQQAGAKHDTLEEAVVHRPVDMIICASGKNSRLGNKFLRDGMDNYGRSYTACSWEGKQGEELTNQGLNTFQDFKKTVVFNKDFHQHFKEQLYRELQMLKDSDDPIRNAVFPEDLAELERQTLDKGMQTRCLENKNQVYIGMELPNPLDGYCHKLKRDIRDQLLKRSTSGSDPTHSQEAFQRATKKALESVKKVVHKAWLQAVAHYHGIDQSIGATSDKINHHFTSVLCTRHQRLEQNFAIREAHEHQLAVTAAGETAVGDHFMLDSGMSGARENVLSLQDFTDKTAKHTDPFDPDLHRAEHETRHSRTTGYVSENARIFLR